MSERRICFDRVLPHELSMPRRTFRLETGLLGAISPKGKKWINGSTLRIRFLSGTKEQQDMVQKFAPEWLLHANLKFEFTDDPRAEIRVAFNPDDGAWSYVGTDNKNIARNEPTLNLGWQEKGVILHEFGHMIGLAHEHQSPKGGIEWDRDAVIKDLSGPPNSWDEETITHNVLDKYTLDQINGTDFDKNSIMLYAFPPKWTKNLPEGTKENNELSAFDKQFIASAQMYPGRDTKTTPDERAVDIAVQEATEAEISTAGEEDLYRFKVTRPGVHVIETTGNTDVTMTLFGPNELTKHIASDDDSGLARNARIQVALQPGTYYAVIRHYNPHKTGEYRVRVSRE